MITHDDTQHNEGLMTGSIHTDSGKIVYSNDFKLDVLKKVQEIGLSATAKLVSIVVTD